MTLVEQLKRDESTRLKPYTDTVGKLTIGTGRNLTDVGISNDESDYLLANDIARTEAELLKALPWTASLDDARQSALINMGFNLGVPGLLEFRHTLGLIQSGDYEAASDEMLNSRWAAQVGARAHRLALQLKTGVWQ
jgi:lysozyme